jgi:S1-C subfamily serine protease
LYSRVTIIDWVIVAFVLAIALWGFREGPVIGVLVVAVTLGFVWLLGAAALHGPVTAELRGDAHRSLILRSLDRILPPSRSVLEALRRIDPAPSIPGRATAVAPPDPAIAADPDVLRASRSVVRVLGTACGLGVEGSGWAAAPGLIVTNAHVLAGVHDASVTTGDGASLLASPVRFDPRNDLALLRVGVDLTPLPIAPQAGRGTTGAVLGYPENGPFSATAGRIGRTASVLTQDAYGRGPVRRSVTSVRGQVRQGNSGGPAVYADGSVATTVFAARVQGGGGYGIPPDPVRAALDRADAPVATGPCVR